MSGHVWTKVYYICVWCLIVVLCICYVLFNVPFPVEGFKQIVFQWKVGSFACLDHRFQKKERVYAENSRLTTKVP